MGNSSIFTQAFGRNLLAPGSTMIRVHDTRLGRVVKVDEIIGDNAPRAFALRQDINSTRHDSPLYLCPECQQPLILRMWKDQSGFYFSHEFKSPACPIKEENRESRKTINKGKYKDSNESALHSLLKTMLESCLLLDTDFSNVKKERWWKGEDGSEYRRPDIQADYKTDLHVAFEIQLSTTYADDIADRMDFARRNKGILIWVAHEVDHSKLRTAFMDSFYANNSNIFIFNDEMYSKSLDAKKLHFECLWIEPNGLDEQHYQMKTKVVTFDDLQFNQERQWAYFFDFSLARQRTEERRKIEQKKAAENHERERRKLLLLELKDKMENGEYGEASAFIEKMCDVNYHLHDSVRLMQYMFSINRGQPYGFNVENNKSLYRNVLNRANKSIRKFFTYFHSAALASGLYASTDGDLRRRIDETVEELRKEKSKSDFYPDRQLEISLQIFFPNSFEHYTDFMKKNKLF